ncbi:MAG: hypothetical protein KME03_18910 [Aphanocapsa lilacina HA4352-LM1]|jgi:hypothetical protein|nr:hypothetical protein [Aphanocapsa lilacina HA4352-LM1]
MDLLKFLWFCLWNLRFESQGSQCTLRLRGLNLTLDNEGNVRIWANQDLRINARYLLNQCDPHFDPDAFLEGHKERQQQAIELIESSPCRARPRREWGTSVTLEKVRVEN